MRQRQSFIGLFSYEFWLLLCIISVTILFFFPVLLSISIGVCIPGAAPGHFGLPLSVSLILRPTYSSFISSPYLPLPLCTLGCLFLTEYLHISSPRLELSAR